MSPPSKSDPKELMITRLESLYLEALRLGDSKTALACLDKIARLQGLYDDKS